MSKEKEIDLYNLVDKLDALNGVDFEVCEKEEIATGNKAFDVTMTRSYYIRLAAKALGCDLAELKKLPMLKYLAVSRQVANFLLSGLEEDKVLFKPIEKSQSA